MLIDTNISENKGEQLKNSRRHSRHSNIYSLVHPYQATIAYPITQSLHGKSITRLFVSDHPLKDC